eukprot:PhM_4_TR4478/c1_g1_i1/m.40752
MGCCTSKDVAADQEANAAPPSFTDLSEEKSVRSAPPPQLAASGKKATTTARPSKLDRYASSTPATEAEGLGPVETKHSPVVAAAPVVKPAAPPPPPPAAADAIPADTDYCGRLTVFFAKYNPRRLEFVNNILEQFAGKEDSLFTDLVRKYGPEPGREGKPVPVTNKKPEGEVDEAAATTENTEQQQQVIVSSTPAAYVPEPATAQQQQEPEQPEEESSGNKQKEAFGGAAVIERPEPADTNPPPAPPQPPQPPADAPEQSAQVLAAGLAEAERPAGPRSFMTGIDELAIDDLENFQPGAGQPEGPSSVEAVEAFTMSPDVKSAREASIKETDVPDEGEQPQPATATASTRPDCVLWWQNMREVHLTFKPSENLCAALLSPNVLRVAAVPSFDTELTLFADVSKAELLMTRSGEQEIVLTKVDSKRNWMQLIQTRSKDEYFDIDWIQRDMRADDSTSEEDDDDDD